MTELFPVVTVPFDQTARAAVLAQANAQAAHLATLFFLSIPVIVGFWIVVRDILTALEEQRQSRVVDAFVDREFIDRTVEKYLARADRDAMPVRVGTTRLQEKEAPSRVMAR